MHRRQLLKWLSSIGVVWSSTTSISIEAATRQGIEKPLPPLPLPVRRDAQIKVAFVLAPGAEVIDFAGPWGVFEYVYPPDWEVQPFELFTVAVTKKPMRMSGGLQIIADYTFKNAPQPNVIVIPALGEEPSTAMQQWIKEATLHADMTMSVCNGAFVLAKTGLLNGKVATAHHGSLTLLQADFSEISVKRGVRFVDNGHIATAGGLSSGMDLALHVVKRFFGNEVAEQTAHALEYQGQGWKHPDSNQRYAKRLTSTDTHPVCPVCEMMVDKTTALSGLYHGKRYYFCSAEDKKRFDRHPDRFIALLQR